MGKRADMKAATRAKVLAIAAALFEQKGYAETTIRDIAATTGMSTGAVFANFTGKDALYAEVYGHQPVTPEQGRELLSMLAGGAIPEWVRPLMKAVA